MNNKPEFSSDKKIFCAALAFVACLQAPSAIAQTASPPAAISDIQFLGNDTTKREILIQELLVRVGDPADPVLIEKSRQAIMDLGLFKSVHSALLPSPSGPILQYTVDEKYYILPIPKLNRSDEGIGYGGQLRLDNLAGLNQQLKITYEQEETDVSSSGRQKVLSVLYAYPRIFGSPYRLDIDSGVERLPIEALSGDTVTATHERTSSYASLKISRWLASQGPSQGWQVGGGLVWRKQSYRHLSGDPNAFQDGTGVGLLGLVEYNEVHDYTYSRGGQNYGVSVELGSPAFGSDNNYSRQLLYYRQYWPVPGRTHHNLDWQLQLGLSSDRLFDADAYSLGGGSSLRGYDSGSFSGNAFFLANVEYHAPLFGYYPLRGTVFIDGGKTFSRNKDISFGDLNWSAGVGLRLKLKAFVRLDLRLDVAYAFDTGETKAYAGSKHVF